MVARPAPLARLTPPIEPRDSFVRTRLHDRDADGDDESSSRHPEFASDPLWDAAVDADERRFDEAPAATFWVDLIAGRIRSYSERLGVERSYALARVGGDASGSAAALTDSEAEVLRRVLCGEQQKVVSSELGIAHSTCSKRCAQALEKLQLDIRAVPLPVVVAAQMASGIAPATCARRSTFAYEGCTFVVIGVARPLVSGGPALTMAERDIARSLVEGRSRWEIARARSTSEQTVSSQLRAIFSKFRSTGRFGLTRRAAELGWFSRAMASAAGE